MENHPIPQDVTSFQFKLIGNMTVKQFAYLAVGAIFTWIFIAIPFSFFLKIFLVPLPIGLGAFFAFLPIEGRPADTMVLLFIKSFFAPNQFIFQKQGGRIFQTNLPRPSEKKQIHKASPKSGKNLEALLQTLHQTKGNALDQKEDAYLKSVSGIFSGIAQPPAPQVFAPSDAVVPMEVSKGEGETEGEIKKELDKEALVLKKEIDEAKTIESNQTSVNAHERVLELEEQLNEVLTQRQDLEKKLLDLSQKLKMQNNVVPKTYAPPPPANKTPLPHSSDAPLNLITGRVKDPRGNVLPNILVEIKDREENPVRAFKTNRLGQFASATSLSNGLYTIIFEDPEGKNKFQNISVEMKGEIVPPIEVVSVDQREELRKALFN